MEKARSIMEEICDKMLETYDGRTDVTKEELDAVMKQIEAQTALSEIDKEYLNTTARYILNKMKMRKAESQLLKRAVVVKQQMINAIPEKDLTKQEVEDAFYYKVSDIYKEERNRWTNTPLCAYSIGILQAITSEVWDVYIKKANKQDTEVPSKEEEQPDLIFC